MLISVERPLSIDSPGRWWPPSCPKLAAGSTHLVLDIPVGPTAKVRSMAGRSGCASSSEFVAARMNLTIDVVITDGRQPVGGGSGRCWRRAT